ncbi:MAG TPA: hypothetical protein VFK02_35300 [Kofleriaceae bacterium]|nr:hypothetical protein [Kofleriaceae bacterium]
MNLSITVANAEDNVESFVEFFRAIDGVRDVRLAKNDTSSMSIHDTISFFVQNPEAGIAIATGIGTLFAALGNRAEVTVTQDGTVIAKRVASKDAAKMVAAAVRATVPRS